LKYFLIFKFTRYPVRPLNPLGFEFLIGVVECWSTGVNTLRILECGLRVSEKGRF
jgi:hypothetical protein